MAFRDLLRTLFRDQRGLLHDRTAHVQSETFRKWVEIYRNYKPETFAAYPVPEGVRMIAEVRSSADLSRLPATLAFYRKEGYNAVLLSLTGKETPADAENVCKLILSSGMRIYFAFSPAGGDGELAASVFPDPGPLADLLRITSMYADGYLLHWRRTSSHYFLHDAPWDAWMIRTVRSGNAKITLLGEIYLGMTAESGEKVRFTVNTPSGVSGAVLNGGGFYGVSAEGMVQEAGKHSALPLWAVILGEKPRYLQTGKKSFAEHLKIKKALEREYLQAGCAGTITLHSDTSRDNLSEWEVPDALK